MLSTLGLVGALSAASLGGLSGCVANSSCPDGSCQSTAQSAKPELMKIAGIGYGATGTYTGYTPGQSRLMAIRASKLDAYRALAEQINGIKIDSNTSVATMTAKSDSFRARVNAVVRGAKVVSVTPMADDNYETVLEVLVDKRFFEDAMVYNSASNSKSYEPDNGYKVSSY
ncbi:LPP20 family lipoprotein [Thiomicrorhabdus aquaedulcis]|uniref:LPP20 family lipoprotein n=1 Tax=Thiomicrorhabdus aquaedulcis TaxID=2211106 RepID=UPI001E500295|nr:LPP20 family lipoprotein [Thiomicrorhabdus aquaedulcis]